VAIRRNGIDNGKVAVGDIQGLIGSRELDSVAGGEFAVDLA